MKLMGWLILLVVILAVGGFMLFDDAMLAPSLREQAVNQKAEGQQLQQQGLGGAITCTDSDGGMTFDVAGTTVVKRGTSVVTMGADECDGNLLIETSCSNDMRRVESVVEDCTLSGRRCQVGKCVSPVDTCSLKISPIAVLDLDRDYFVNEPIQFEGSDSFGPKSTIVSWEWDFGDGTTSTEQNPIHTYSNYGAFKVKVRVIDNCGLGGERTQMINLHAPFGLIRYDFPLETDRLVKFTVNREPQPNDLYFWQLPDGLTSLSSVAYHRFREPGVYTITLTIYDSTTWQVKESAQIEVVVQTPLAPLSYVEDGFVGTKQGLAIVDGRAWTTSSQTKQTAVIDGLAPLTPFLAALDVGQQTPGDISSGMGMVAIAKGASGVYVYQSPPAGEIVPQNIFTPIYHLDTWALYGLEANSVEFYGRILYVGTDDGLLVVDTRDPDPSQWSVQQYSIGLANWEMAIAYDRLYVATFAPAGVRVVDISDPLQPANIGLLPLTFFPRRLSVSYASDLARLGMFGVLSPKYRIEFYEISRNSPTINPQYLSRIDVSEDVSSLTMANKAAYISLFTTIRKFDLSDPTNPQESVWRPLGSGGNIGGLEYFNDGRVYVSSYQRFSIFSA